MATTLFMSFATIARSFTTPRLLAFRRTHRCCLHATNHDDTLTPQDEVFLRQAIDCAKKGVTHTFPNPPVGCVIVNSINNTIVGQGFHPRAGYPHAEVFALLEAAQHVPSGIAAAQAVIDNTSQVDKILVLTETYCSPGGADTLFSSLAESSPRLTAYVTLEPCSHTGRTPPCAKSLVAAGIQRVVVGVRDPNPVVDGGGLALLHAAGITTAVATDNGRLHTSCQQLIQNFAKRMTAEFPLPVLTGKERRTLRAMASRKQRDKTLVAVEWGRGPFFSYNDGDETYSLEQAIQDFPIAPEWMENVDDVLWQHELIQVKLKKAVGKRKHAEALGQRMATLLQAHLAQSKGHGVLLYRPGIPRKLQWENTDNSEEEASLSTESA